jgi:hypothetical protein
MIGTPLATPILPVEDDKDVARLTMNQREMVLMLIKAIILILCY